MHKPLDVTDAVIEAVASRQDVDPLDLRPPLYEVVDPDGLERLVGSASAEGRSDVVVRFDYAGYEVTVDSDGSVTVSE